MRFRFRRARGLTLADVCVVLVLALLLVGWLLPSLGGRTRIPEYRVKCASNLRQIGQGIQMYANENKGNFPRTLYDGFGAPPTEYTGWDAPNPFAAGGPAPNDVTAALFLLLRTQDLTPEVFVCPSSQGERWDFGGKPVTAVSNFPGGQYLTYSYVNAYPTPEALKDGFKLNYTLTSDFAIAADINPGAPGVTSVGPSSPRKEMMAANSTNHSGDGQNVLYADGHVEFQNAPFCGMLRGVPPAKGFRDNIYTAGAGFAAGTPGLAVRGSPVDALDSVLLPVGIFTGSATGEAVLTQPTASQFVTLGAAATFAAVVVGATLVRRRSLVASRLKPAATPESV